MGSGRQKALDEAYGAASAHDSALRRSRVTREEEFRARARGQRERYGAENHRAGASGSLEPVSKTDSDVLRENFEFLREEPEAAGADAPVEQDYGEKLARKHYEQLYKEYAIANLTRYKEGLLGLRWCTEAEVLSGKGSTSCGAEKCEKTESLATYEVPFSYVEKKQQKMTLVKLMLCPRHSKRMIKANKARKRKRSPSAEKTS